MKIMMKPILLILVMLLSTACSWGTDSESAIGRVNDVKGNPWYFGVTVIWSEDLAVFLES